MSNRCPDCNKFVGLEQGEPEVGSLDIDADGTITGDVRLVLTCADCGGEMKETTIDFDIEDPEVLAHIDAHKEAGQAFTLEVEENGVDANDRHESVDRKGKRIPYRYQRHFYGFDLTLKVTCSCQDGEEFEVTVSGEEQASGFDEMF